MEDELIEETCEICGRVVYTHMYEGGYGGRGYYNHKNVLVHEERRINVPEQDYPVEAFVCQDCIDKDPSLHVVLLRKRREWFDERIACKKNEIKHNYKEMERLEKEIPDLSKDLKGLIAKKKELR